MFWQASASSARALVLRAVSSAHCTSASSIDALRKAFSATSPAASSTFFFSRSLSARSLTIALTFAMSTPPPPLPLPPPTPTPPFALIAAASFAAKNATCFAFASSAVGWPVPLRSSATPTPKKAEMVSPLSSSMLVMEYTPLFSVSPSSCLLTTSLSVVAKIVAWPTGPEKVYSRMLGTVPLAGFGSTTTLSICIL